VRLNEVLSRLDAGDRDVLAGLLEQVFVAGVHPSLAVLHWHELPPFDDSYEGVLTARAAG
jgi:hypothetical protein